MTSRSVSRSMRASFILANHDVTGISSNRIQRSNRITTTNSPTIHHSIDHPSR